MVALSNPYPSAGRWLRGNLHAHTTNSDGVRPPEQVVADYRARGYDFLALSDHDTFTDPDALGGDDALTLVPAVECSANGPHLLHLGAPGPVDPDRDRQAVIDAIDRAGGIAVPAHPNWKADFAHWPQEDLASLRGIAAIEVFNGLIEHHPGAALATDRWDQLLSAGHRVWGIATDDAHRPWEVAQGWTVVRTTDPSAGGILAAIEQGACYASTGVVVERVDVADGVIAVDTTNADEIRLVSDHGLVQQTVADSRARFRVPEQLVHGSDHTYVRVECHGSGHESAWLQPMFLDADSAA